jgi:hypothetical protein
MTTPLLPDTADLDTFGGTFEDFDGVVDPQTELAARYYNRLTTQAAAVSHTASRAMARCSITGGSIALEDHDAVWGATESVEPTPARSGAGDYTVTWAASYDDLQDDPEEHTVSIRFADGQGYKSGAARIVNIYRVSATQVAIKAYDAAGVAAELDEFTVWVR